MNKKYKINEFAKLVGVSAHTVRRWEKEGRLTVARTLTNQRYFTDQDVQRVLRLRLESKPKQCVIYCRVSSPSQKDDLASQVDAMEAFSTARGLVVSETVKEIAGGMNMSRPKFLGVVFGIINGEIGTLVIAHKDRLARFGFELIENLADNYGCKIIVANQEKLSSQQEMVEDLMAIIHTFSCRLYGLRKYKSKKDLFDDPNT
jgi:putative resolvase